MAVQFYRQIQEVFLGFWTTTLAGAAGIIGAMAASWSISKKPDLSMILNGSLAGLVGIKLV